MGKIIKIFLSQGFTPINQSVFKLGTTIDFDCYIKRFNGFVILIEKGTFLDEKMHQKITKSNLQVYVENKEYQKYQKYSIHHGNKSSVVEFENSTLQELIENTQGIRKKIATKETISEKLHIIYHAGKNLLNAWVLEKESTLIPFDTLKLLVGELISIVNKERITLSHFNDFLDEKYSLPTHLMKVAFFSSIIGSQIGLDMSDQENLVLAAMIHDVGKCDVDDELLEKPDVLTENEFKIVQGHADASVSLARRSGIKERMILNAIREHHERLDGSGYPRALRGERISQFGKILAVCDVFDALITEKPYRAAYSTFNASSLLRDEYQKKLDTEYINTLIKHLK